MTAVVVPPELCLALGSVKLLVDMNSCVVALFESIGGAFVCHGLEVSLASRAVAPHLC